MRKNACCSKTELLRRHTCRTFFRGEIHCEQALETEVGRSRLPQIVFLSILVSAGDPNPSKMKGQLVFTIVKYSAVNRR